LTASVANPDEALKDMTLRFWLFSGEGMALTASSMNVINDINSFSNKLHLRVEFLNFLGALLKNIEEKVICPPSKGRISTDLFDYYRLSTMLWINKQHGAHHLVSKHSSR
jgi:hypothetical protein